MTNTVTIRTTSKPGRRGAAACSCGWAGPDTVFDRAVSDHLMEAHGLTEDQAQAADRDLFAHRFAAREVIVETAAKDGGR